MARVLLLRMLRCVTSSGRTGLTSKVRIPSASGITFDTGDCGASWRAVTWTGKCPAGSRWQSNSSAACLVLAVKSSPYAAAADKLSPNPMSAEPKSVRVAGLATAAVQTPLVPLADQRPAYVDGGDVNQASDAEPTFPPSVLMKSPLGKFYPKIPSYNLPLAEGEASVLYTAVC